MSAERCFTRTGIFAHIEKPLGELGRKYGWRRAWCGAQLVDREAPALATAVDCKVCRYVAEANGVRVA